ncbi:hypothetical protein IFM89_022173, partial [Coptis chinensis]
WCDKLVVQWTSAAGTAAPTTISRCWCDKLVVQWTSAAENVEGSIASGRPQVETEIRNGNSSSPVDNIITLVHAECDMQDMHEVGLVKKKPDMDKQREIQAIKAGLPNKTCLCRRPGHSSLDVTPGATLPLVSTTMLDLWDPAEPPRCQRKQDDTGLPRM